MTGGFFSELEVELGSLTRAGAHLSDSAGRRRRRAVGLIRRGAAIAMLALALGASLDSEFPATANGYDAVTPSIMQGS